MIEIGRPPRNTRAIPLTPLIDVVFLLMVFFILTTNFVEVEALKLGILEEDAPTAHSDQSAPSVQQLVLLGSGAAFLNNKLVYFDDLEDSLDVIFTRSPEAAMAVKSDVKVPVQMLVDVLDMIYRSGGRNVRVSRWHNSRKM